MFVKDKFSQESYIHVCNNLSEKQMRNKKIEVRLHDVNTFISVYNEEGNHNIEHIKHCPYCGCNLEEEANAQ